MDAFTNVAITSYPEVNIPSDNEDDGAPGSTPGCVIARQEVNIPSNFEDDGAPGSTPGCVVA